MSDLIPDTVVEPVEHVEDGWAGNRTKLPFVTDRVLLTRVDLDFDLVPDWAKEPSEEQKKAIPAENCAELWSKAGEQSSDAFPLAVDSVNRIPADAKPWWVNRWLGKGGSVMSRWSGPAGDTWYLNGLWLWLVRRWLNPDELRPTEIGPKALPEDFSGRPTAVAAYRDGQMVAVLQSMTPSSESVESMEPIDREVPA